MAKALVFDYESTGLGEADRALCEFAENLTAAPGDMDQGDIERLHSFGFSDEQITIAVQVVGYFNYINRIADGLGVDPEAEMPALVSEHDWKQRKRRRTGKR